MKLAKNVTAKRGTHSGEATIHSGKTKLTSSVQRVPFLQPYTYRDSNIQVNFIFSPKCPIGEGSTPSAAVEQLDINVEASDACVVSNGFLGGSGITVSSTKLQDK